MEDWCNYSDLPSPEWWERMELIDKTVVHIRKDLHEEVEKIILLSEKQDLNKLEQLTKKPKFDSTAVSSVCIELDFLASKLKYFGKLNTSELRFGINIDLIPELIAKWRDEKINKII